MALIKVSSTLENSMRYPLHELIKDEKGSLKGKSRNFVKNSDGEIIRVDEIPAFKTIVIKGRNRASKEMKGFVAPYALTTMESKDWEHLKAQYGYAYEVKNGLIFADKNEGETIARSLSDEQKEKKTGTDPLTVKDLDLSGDLQELI